jgi:hypothetical protein
MDGGSGGERAGGGDRGEGRGDRAGRVVHVPNRMTQYRWVTIGGVLATLFLGLAYALTRPPAATGRGAAPRASDPALLAEREAILDRIVALDARHRAGEISEYAYWQKREALKGDLVLLMEEAVRRDAGAGRTRGKA